MASAIKPLAELGGFVDRVFAGQLRHHARWGREMSFGMLASHSCSLTKIAFALKERATGAGPHSRPGKKRRLIHVVKRLDRSLLDPRVDDDALEDRRLEEVGSILRSRNERWVVSIDTTDLGHPYCQPWLDGGMEFAYSVRDGSRRAPPPKDPRPEEQKKKKKKKAPSPTHRGYEVIALHAATLDRPGDIPVLRHLFSQGEPRLQNRSWFAVALEQIRRARPFLPDDFILVADRGFFNKAFMEGLDNADIPTWVVRAMIKRRDRMAQQVYDSKRNDPHRLGDLADSLKQPYTVRLDEGVQRKVRATFSFGYRKIWFRDSGRCREDARRSGPARTLIVAQHPKADRPIALIVNKPVGRREAADIIKAYMQRWTVEEDFRISKDTNGFGFGIEKARCRKFIAQRRLLFLSTLVSTLLSVLAYARRPAAKKFAQQACTTGKLPQNIMYRLISAFGLALQGAPRWTARRWFHGD